MTGALHITSSWGGCFWVRGENCSHSNVGWAEGVDFLILLSFFFLVLHTTTCILHCTAANHSFPPASDTLQKGDGECQEQRSQMMPLLQKRGLGSWCPALHSFAQQVSKGARLLSGYLSQTRTGKALMPDFQTMFLTLLARASKLISWAGSLSGHVLTPSYFAKLAFVFLVLFTSCQVIKWVKGAPVLSSRDHSRCIPGIPRAQAACSKGQPRPGASLSLSRCPKSVSPCLSPVDYV